MSEIRSMAGQNVYLSREAVPGTAETDDFFGVSALKLTPGWDGTRESFRGGSGKVVTSTMGVDEYSPWETDLMACFNHLGLVAASRFAIPTTTTPGGGTNSRNHVFAIDPDAEDLCRYYTAKWGDGYYLLQGDYGYFDSLGMDIERGQLAFTTEFRSRAAQFVAASTLPTNEVQSITVSGTPTSGDFTLQLPFVSGSPTTAGIAYDATAAAVKSAIAALSGIDAEDVTVTGGPLLSAPFIVTFHGRYAQTSLATMIGADTFDTGGVTLAQVTDGSQPTDMEAAPMPSNMWDVYIDDSWANLGNTQYGGAYKANPSFGEKFDRDAPLNSSIVSYEKPIEKMEQDDSFELIIRLGATAEAQADAFAVGTKQFFRLELDSSSGPNPYYIEGSIPWLCQLDLCAEITSKGQITTAPNSSAVVMPLTLVPTKDPDTGNYAELTLQNTVTTY